MQKKPVSPAKASAVAVMLCLGVALLALIFITISSYFIGKYAIESGRPAPQFLRTIASLVIAILIFSLLLSAIFTGIWMFHITRNVTTAFKNNKLIKPALATVGWYIPLFNLFFPFRQLRICQQLLISNLPYGIHYKFSLYPIILWQIGLSIFIILQLFAVIMIWTYEDYLPKMSITVIMIQVFAVIIGCVGSIITIFQYFRLEKLVYPHLSSPTQTELHA